MLSGLCVQVISVNATLLLAEYTINSESTDFVGDVNSSLNDEAKYLC